MPKISLFDSKVFHRFAGYCNEYFERPQSLYSSTILYPVLVSPVFWVRGISSVHIPAYLYTSKLVHLWPGICAISYFQSIQFFFTCTTVLGLCGSKVLPSSGQVCCNANSAQKWENFNSSSTTGQCFGIISAQFSLTGKSTLIFFDQLWLLNKYI